jgi:hypothetical protein
MIVMPVTLANVVSKFDPVDTLAAPAVEALHLDAVRGADGHRERDERLRRGVEVVATTTGSIQ